jgi:hypothetical protein
MPRAIVSWSVVLTALLAVHLNARRITLAKRALEIRWGRTEVSTDWLVEP